MRTPFRYAESWPGALITLALAVGSSDHFHQLPGQPSLDGHCGARSNIPRLEASAWKGAAAAAGD